MPAPLGPAELSFGPGPGERAEADQPAPFPAILPREVRSQEDGWGHIQKLWLWDWAPVR